MPHSDYHTNPSGMRSLGGVLLAQRIPLDVWIVGSVQIAFGAYAALLTVLTIMGIAKPAGTTDCLPVLLQHAGLRGEFWVVVYCAELSGESILGGIGILRGRRWGWWLLLVSTVLGTVLNIGDLFGLFSHTAILGLAMDAGLLTWLVVRSKLYRPLG